MMVYEVASFDLDREGEKDTKDGGGKCQKFILNPQAFIPGLVGYLIFQTGQHFKYYV